jgi:hypothetical protein
MAISDPWARAEGPLYDIKGDDTVCKIVYHWNHVKCLLSWKGKEEKEENEKERKEGIKFREFLFLLSLSLLHRALSSTGKLDRSRKFDQPTDLPHLPARPIVSWR